MNQGFISPQSQTYAAEHSFGISRQYVALIHPMKIFHEISLTQNISGLNPCIFLWYAPVSNNIDVKICGSSTLERASSILINTFKKIIQSISNQYGRSLNIKLIGLI